MLATAHSVAADEGTVARELRQQLGEGHRLVLFFASSKHRAQALACALATAFPEARVAGCSTMGEVGPKGLTTGGVSALGLGEPCRVAAQVVKEARGFHFVHGMALVDSLSAELGVSELRPERHVLVTLTDGLCGAEERLVAALGLAAPRVDLVGGSAADDLDLVQTWVSLDGVVYPSASLVLALEPNQPFRAFQIHHFDATDRRVVVTSSDPDRRVVKELDGFPAAEVMAELLEVDVEVFRERTLLPSERDLSFAYAIGGQSFMRSPMQILGSELVMRGAVEEGVVLRVMRGGDLVDRTREGLSRSLHPSAQAVLAFNCGGRLLEARAKGLEEALHEALQPVPTVGFSTYAEQYGPLLVNHTLTGLALG